MGEQTYCSALTLAWQAVEHSMLDCNEQLIQVRKKL